MVELYYGKLKFISAEEPYFLYKLRSEEEVKTAVTGIYSPRLKTNTKKKVLTSDDIFHIVEGVIKNIGDTVKGDSHEKK